MWTDLVGSKYCVDIFCHIGDNTKGIFKNWPYKVHRVYILAVLFWCTIIQHLFFRFWLCFVLVFCKEQVFGSLLQCYCRLSLSWCPRLHESVQSGYYMSSVDSLIWLVFENNYNIIHYVILSNICMLIRWHTFHSCPCYADNVCVSVGLLGNSYDILLMTSKCFILSGNCSGWCVFVMSSLPLAVMGSGVNDPSSKMWVV